ncbi:MULTISPECIES: DUF4148 domain-containing protein [Burkholderiaceae]|uniref:Purine nucleoside phosphorylase n=1 Tax=Caballeronia zhejiangensis TaxID=871203 RepID=A0A656Q7W2_9BURK|nr:MULTISPECIES: DUF4148 domain-containing protein [Burkholderiaceae]KAK42454.1 hypothetical protein BG58_41770 [Caballeronia jiangsuensis]KDR24692.1 hypothetical protein BG60_35780 [Caballeronia zhejiangensis]KWU19269.1 hypothetical protein AS149_13535 [Burkholderia cenocepacia]SAL58137.1 hypothetical protein AWB71_03183 [Caballeronia peredens]
MRIKSTIISLSLSIAVLGTFAGPLTYAQDTGSTATNPEQSAPMTKEQKKAARKQARAKKNAELKKLEDAGYNPASRDNATYPQNLQNAQKKIDANAAKGQ